MLTQPVPKYFIEQQLLFFVSENNTWKSFYEEINKRRNKGSQKLEPSMPSLHSFLWFQTQALDSFRLKLVQAYTSFSWLPNFWAQASKVRDQAHSISRANLDLETILVVAIFFFFLTKKNCFLICIKASESNDVMTNHFAVEGQDPIGWTPTTSTSTTTTMTMTTMTTSTKHLTFRNFLRKWHFRRKWKKQNSEKRTKILRAKLLTRLFPGEEANLSRTAQFLLFFGSATLDHNMPEIRHWFK